MQTSLNVTQGEFTLNRYPQRSNEQLRAWDASDELILNHLAQLQKTSPTANVLIINDHFGALSVALHALAPSMQSDSYISQLATNANLKSNGLPPIDCINSMSPLNGPYDLVIIKVQKSLAQLEDQLHKLRQHLHPDTVIIGTAMVKMIHSSTLKLFENIIGPTTTSLAKKKARLIHCQYDSTLNPGANPYPQRFTLAQGQLSILNHANVFSRAKLDIGCRFFIENLPCSDQPQTIIDLGCGNGIVGIVAAQNNPQAKVEFYDESHMAVASARYNFSQAFSPARAAEFHVDDCLSSRAANSADIILNNPPFHQQNAIGDFIAWQMFSQSHKVLKSGGELWVIGNRHLDYALKLKKIFGNCQQITSNKKFVILRAIKRAS